MKADHNYKDLNEKLESTSQQAIKNLVSHLPEDTLSMAWRSSLNERLIKESTSKTRKFRFSWFAMPAAGLALAAALAVAVYVHPAAGSNPTSAGPQSAVTKSSSLESGLLETYSQESISHEIIGSGPDPSSDVSHPSIADIATESDSSEGDSDSI